MVCVNKAHHTLQRGSRKAFKWSISISAAIVRYSSPAADVLRLVVVEAVVVALSVTHFGSCSSAACATLRALVPPPPPPLPLPALLLLPGV